MGSNTFAEKAGSEVLPGAKHVANGKCQTYAGSALDPGGVSPTMDNSGLFRHTPMYEAGPKQPGDVSFAVNNQSSQYGDRGLCMVAHCLNIRAM